MSNAGFCTDCGFRVESFEGLTCCPSCKSRGIPCNDDGQLNVAINWHELHILCVWAENHQRTHNLGRTVYAIAKRLEAQFPDRGPLTLAGELGEISKVYETSVNDPALRRDIAEQTGEEVGLVRKPPEKQG